jgi:hypothetical protein
MGFTQRQAEGTSSRDESEALIAQLLDAESDGTIAIPAPSLRQSAQDQGMSSPPPERPADEFVVAAGLPWSPRAGELGHEQGNAAPTRRQPSG